jgi:hypothetical protein
VKPRFCQHDPCMPDSRSIYGFRAAIGHIRH